MPHLFVSYVREDQAIVDRLCNELTAEGFDVWLDRDQILPGQRWQAAIRRAIQDGAYFLACFSERSIERTKSYMNEELTIAIDELRKRPTDHSWFIPILLSNCLPPDREIGGGETLRCIHWVSLYASWEDGVKSLKAAIKSPTPVPAKICTTEFNDDLKGSNALMQIEESSESLAEAVRVTSDIISDLQTVKSILVERAGEDIRLYGLVLNDSYYRSTAAKVDTITARLRKRVDDYEQCLDRIAPGADLIAKVIDSAEASGTRVSHFKAYFRSVLGNIAATGHGAANVDLVLAEKFGSNVALKESIWRLREVIQRYTYNARRAERWVA